MDIEALIYALENENNVNVIDTNKRKIKCDINDILQQLPLESKTLKLFNKNLRNYIYTSNINDIKIGHSIRYINIENPDNIKLSQNYLICNINANKKGIIIALKSFNNRFFTIYFHKYLIFKKISNEENFILKALEQITK